jgi:hypothetical protein
MTAARTSAQNAAMEALLEAHATELKLPTVKARFRAVATEATREQQTLRPRPTASDSATAARAQPEHFRHHQQPTTTDERWGHFKRDGGATASGDTHVKPYLAWVGIAGRPPPTGTPGDP